MATLTRSKPDAVFHAIADPTRRQILSLLRTNQRTVGDIAGNFRTSRPAISKHLRVLRTAGLITTRQVGTARVCLLNAAPLREVSDWVREYEMLWGESLLSLKSYVEEKS